MILGGKLLSAYISMQPPNRLEADFGSCNCFQHRSESILGRIWTLFGTQKQAFCMGGPSKIDYDIKLINHHTIATMLAINLLYLTPFCTLFGPLWQAKNQHFAWEVLQKSLMNTCWHIDPWFWHSESLATHPGPDFGTTLGRFWTDFESYQKPKSKYHTWDVFSN